MTTAITKEIQALDPDMPVYDVNTMDHRLYDSLARRRFAMFLLGVFAVIASILAAIGIYGVMAYSVNERTDEIGIRLALGATREMVLGTVLSEGLRLVAGGIAIGMLAAFALTKLLETLLFEVRPRDPVTFVAAPVLLALVALLACVLPARRAAGVDPVETIRSD